MPGSTTTKKNLYIAKNLTELNAKAETPMKINDGQCRMYVKTSDKVYKNAEEAQILGDEERAYVLFMKFLNIVQIVRKTAEYKKHKDFYDNMMGRDRLTNALTHAEELSTGLKERYEEQEAKEVSARLEALDAKEPEKPQENEAVETMDTEDKDTANNTEPAGKPGFLSCEKLYSLMTDGSSTLLIFDVRAEEEFLSSHIKHDNCVNIPRNIVPPGCTVHHIEASLPADSKGSWTKRGNVDFVVLLDWSCGEKDLVTGTPLCSLKDAIYRWDQDVVIKSEPLVLDGGYEEWLNYYPTWTTNALIPRPTSNSTLSSDVISLDKIDYDFDFFKTPEEKAAERRSQLLEQMEKERDSNISSEKQTPMIPDRTKKPGAVPNNLIHPSNSVTQIVEKSIERINNDLNSPNNSTLSLAQKSKDQNKPTIGKLKESNMVIEKQIKENRKPPEPEVPDRTLKPSAKTSNVDAELTRNDSKSSVGSTAGELERTPSEGGGLGGLQTVGSQEKVEGNQQLERERQRILLETEARKAKLEAEKDQIERLRQVKTKEAEETAALMRKKREVEEQLRQLEDERNLKEKEEKLRQEAMRKQGDEKAKQAELAALRNKRKEQQAETERAEKERLAQEDLKKQEAEKARLAREEQIKQEAEKAKLAREEQIKQEMARQEQLKKEEEALKARELKLLKEKKQLEERERKRREEMERRRQEEERKRAQEEEARKLEEARTVERERVEQERRKKEEQQRKEQEARERQQKEQQGAERRAGVLPTGWEKRYDQSKGAYYYINHDTKTTQWEPPQAQVMSSSPKVVPKGPSPQRQVTPAKGERYTVKLKDEGEQSSTGGLKRSHSSPNIAKLMDPEGEKPFQPLVNRSQKPQNATRPEIKELQRPQVISEAKVRNFTPVWGSMGHGLTGLRNQGNTCYMNSTLQCMSNTGFLTTYLLTESYRHDINVHNKFGTRGEIAEEYSAVVRAMWSGQYKSVTPRDFKLSCARHCSTFAGYDQQDSQEFLSYLLDWLHEDLNKIPKRPKLPDQENDGVSDEVAAEKAWKLHKTVHDSIVVDLFQGQFKSTVTCKVCEKKSVTFDTFMYLSLEIPSKTRCTLRDCLLNFSQEEHMTGDSKWNCPKCKVKRNAVKRIVIWKLPPILIIVLKRFCQTGMWRQKNSAYVDFPLDNADFQKFVSGPQLRKPFSLFAVSNHYGTMDGGHYTAFCKNPKLNRWFKFDDHEVYEYSQSDVKSAAAYFLFYSSIGQM